MDTRGFSRRLKDLNRTVKLYRSRVATPRAPGDCPTRSARTATQLNQPKSRSRGFRLQTNSESPGKAGARPDQGLQETSKDRSAFHCRSGMNHRLRPSSHRTFITIPAPGGGGIESADCLRAGPPRLRKATKAHQGHCPEQAACTNTGFPGPKYGWRARAFDRTPDGRPETIACRPLRTRRTRGEQRNRSGVRPELCCRFAPSGPRGPDSYSRCRALLPSGRIPVFTKPSPARSAVPQGNGQTG